MIFRSTRKRTARPNRYRRLAARSHSLRDDGVISGGDMPAWRSLLRFLVLGLLVVGSIYLSTVSLNLLVLGTDDVDYSKHTDTIMLIHWRPLPRRLSLLSVPRDTLIRMPKRGPMKINAVYAYGSALGSREYALAMTRASIETLLGLKVHYVIHIRYSNFIRLVDALGGVPLYVAKRMQYTDQAGGVNINLQPGYQLLDGRQSLNYVRFRMDREGDIGRIRRQQEFFQAFVGQMARFTKLPRTLGAFYTFFKQVETNLSFPTAIFLAMEVKNTARESWRRAILPGKAVYLNGRSFWEPDRVRLRRVVAALGRLPRQQNKDAGTPEPVVSGEKKTSHRKPVKAEVTPKPTPRRVLAPLPSGKQPIVRILNGCGVPGVAGRGTKRLMNKRIRIQDEDTTNAPSFDYAYTIIKCKQGNLPWARRIAAVLELDEERIQVIPKKVSYPTVTVVIGGDYRELMK